MTTNRILIALLALPLVALASAAHARPYGAQVEAPPWSFACMTDHGPSQCGEPMWVYGSAR